MLSANYIQITQIIVLRVDWVLGTTRVYKSELEGYNIFQLMNQK